MGEKQLRESLEGQKGVYSGLLKGWLVDGIDLPTKGETQDMESGILSILRHFRNEMNAKN